MQTSLGFRLSLFLFSVAIATVGGSFLWNLRAAPAGEPQPRLRTATIVLNDVRITAEVATSDDERRRGLSYRTSLGQNEGMLFLFPVVARQTMWMQGMNFPLDILFISNGRVVDYEENVPLASGISGRVPEASSIEEVDMVLELPAGRAKELGVGIRTPVQIR